MLRLFLVYYPQLIDAGMVFKSVPPLYAIPKGKKNKYFTENIDLVRYVQQSFSKNYTITDLKNRKLTSRELTNLFLLNADYMYYLDDNASAMYALPWDLLELILIHYIKNKDKFVFAKLDKEIKSKYRFMTDNKKMGKNILIHGTIDESYSVYITDQLLLDCADIINLMKKNNSLEYKVNGKKCTIGQIMDLYSKSEPATVQRYKGLGEMDAEELAESTLLPTSDRMLIRYTLEDAKETIQTIREYESNPKMILQHIGNVTREDLLD